MKYTILFELYGKKMKTDVDAATPHQAQEELKEIIANKIIFESEYFFLKRFIKFLCVSNFLPQHLYKLLISYI